MSTWPGTSVTLDELAQLVDLLAAECVADVIFALAAETLDKQTLRQKLSAALTDTKFAEIIDQLTARHIIEALPDAHAGCRDARTVDVRYQLTEPGRALLSRLAALATWRLENENHAGTKRSDTRLNRRH